MLLSGEVLCNEILLQSCLLFHRTQWTVHSATFVVVVVWLSDIVFHGCEIRI